MKKLFSIVLAAVMVLALAAPAFAADTITIGVYEPLTGDNGPGGKQEYLGMQYANLETPTVEVGGTTYDVELVVADNESSTDKAVSAATQLVAENAPIVLGSYGSSVAIAGADTFGEAGIPVIGVTCTNPQVTIGNDHYFRICFTDPGQGAIHAQFAKNSLGASKVYCLGELGNDYDQGLLNYFQDTAAELGLEVQKEDFPNGTSDFTAYLTNAKNFGAEVIFAPCSIPYGQLIIQQAASQGLDVVITGPDTWDSNMIMDSVVATGLDVYCTTFYGEGGAPEFEEGFKEYLNSDDTALTNNGGNDMIAAVSVMGYDAYYVALEAIKAAGSADPADIMAALPGVTYEGATGAIAFGENGDAVRSTAFIKHANAETGQWEAELTELG